MAGETGERCNGVQLIMAYSRWSHSYWYTYWRVQPEGVEETRDNTLFDVCNVCLFTAKELRDDIEACVKQAKDICERRGFETQPTPFDLDELRLFMLQFLHDVDQEYKMPSTEQLDSTALIKELVGTKCRCGSRKQSRMSFCGRCYHSLSKEHKSALYLPIGSGYESAYASAIDVLIEKRRIKHD